MAKVVQLTERFMCIFTGFEIKKKMDKMYSPLKLMQKAFPSLF